MSVVMNGRGESMSVVNVSGYEWERRERVSGYE